MKFRLINSVHSGPGGGSKTKVKRHKKGAIIESKENLMKLFPNKFELLEDPRVKKPDPPAVSESSDDEAEPDSEDAAAEKPTETPAEEAAETLGKDVTKKFPKALKADLMVFQTRKGTFQVAKEDEPTTALNKEPLKQKDVQKFIDSLDDDEDDDEE